MNTNNPSNAEIFAQNYKKDTDIILGASIAVGISCVAAVVTSEQPLNLTPAAFEVKPLGFDGLIVGLFAVSMAAALRKNTSSAQSDAVLNENEKIILASQDTKAIEKFSNYKADIKKYENISLQRWRKSRNTLLYSVGGAVLASAITVGAAVVGPAALVIGGLSTVAGIYGIVQLNSSEMAGKVRKSSIDATTELAHSLNKPAFK